MKRNVQSTLRMLRCPPLPNHCLNIQTFDPILRLNVIDELISTRITGLFSRQELDAMNETTGYPFGIRNQSVWTHADGGIFLPIWYVQTQTGTREGVQKINAVLEIMGSTIFLWEASGGEVPFSVFGRGGYRVSSLKTRVYIITWV